ncbi:msr0098 [Mesorhizobium japonicum MAFF 303099]|uniref:Msr0098 protein n=1 Tax=Mesorhizobium japonicum (strain LMG 29417 / CECT 9101 / MAFF 303099) TaxID=266835 RepID=Q98NK7_RHILO|nr:msr0098 [Mesorhizobium japonicum MAFF 303099]
MFLRARPGEHFREETHESGSWLVLHASQYR